MQFYGNFQLQVDGALQAVGQGTNRVIFTSGKAFPHAGDWPGVRFAAASAGGPSVVSNAVVEYAVAGIACTNTSPKIANSWIHYCSQQGIWLTGSSPLIQGNTIERNSSDGIYCTDASSPQILNNNIQANTLYGIRTLGTGVVGHNSLPVIRGNTLDGNGTYAVYTITYYQPGQAMIDAGSNWWGTADATVIPSKIYDYADNPASSPVVNFGNWLGSSGGTPAPGRCVSGQIVGNTVWQVSDSPIGVIGPVLVTSNATLTIQPGVEVDFYGSYALQVDGVLQALGGANNPITMTSGDAYPLPGDWLGIRFSSASVGSQCVVSNVVLEYAVAGVACTNVSPRIVNCWIHDCSQQGVWLTGSSSLVQGNTIEYNGSDGIYCTDTSSPQILNNSILANTLYGIRTLGTGVAGHNSLPVIRSNTLDANGTYAVYAITYYQPGQAVVDARSNWWGTADGTLIVGKIYDYADSPASSPVLPSLLDKPAMAPDLSREL